MYIVNKALNVHVFFRLLKQDSIELKKGINLFIPFLI